MTSETLWYCLRTRPKTERMTSRVLRAEAGIEVFCPFIRFERARSTGKTWVTEALFPCYLFAKFDYAQQHRQVRASSGVVTIVGFGREITPVAPAIIEELRSSVRDEEIVTVAHPITAGDEVHVVEGPFRGIRAVVNRVMPAKERVALLLEVLGMEREIEISTSMVLPDLPHPMAKREK